MINQGVRRKRASVSVTLGTGCQPDPKEMERAAALALRLTAISEPQGLAGLCFECASLFQFSEPGLAALAVPVFAQRRFAGAQVVANPGGQKPPMLRRPLFSKHHVVVCRAAK